MNTAPRRITVTIDELVLHGFDQRDGARIADAIRAELSGAIEGWAPATGASVTRLDAGSVTVAPSAAPDLVGRAVARRIGHALPQPGRS
jgi:hypothetical protein